MDRIVKVEAAHTPETPNIRDLFSKYGEIRAFLPYKTSKPDNIHCFIEFALKEGAERALSLNPAGPSIHVYSLAMNPHLVEQYRSVALSPLNISATVTISASDGLARNISPSLTDLQPQSFSLPSPPVESFLQSLKSIPISKPQEKWQNYLANVVPSGGSSESTLLPPQPALPISRAPPSAAASLPSPISPLVALPGNGGPFFSLERRIIMSLCGETISYDLEALEDDPQTIIALLKATSSERGHWMIVAGQYRRKGNPNAAIAVVTTMIEVMTANGIPEEDIKPAFLMLSGCETDLWKRTKLASGEDSDTSTAHYSRAQQWLQKVYGTQQPQSLPQPTDAFGLGCADTARSLLAAQVGPKTASTLPDALVERISSAEGLPISTLAASSAANTRPESPATSLRTMERQVQSLRDSQENQSLLLNDTRSAKRKVEADYASERNLRRKLERHLDDLNKELSLARRSEGYALEQLKREVETRRRAEDSLHIERDRRREVERLAEQRTVKPLYEDLAHMFQRAAQGDELAFAGYGAPPFNH